MSTCRHPKAFLTAWLQLSMFCQFFYRQHLLICLQKLPFLLHLCQLLSSPCHFHLQEPSKSIWMPFVLCYSSQWRQTTSQQITARRIFSYTGGVSLMQAKAKGNSHEWFAAGMKKEPQGSERLARAIKAAQGPCLPPRCTLSLQVCSPAQSHDLLTEQSWWLHITRPLQHNSCPQWAALLCSQPLKYRTVSTQPFLASTILRTLSVLQKEHPSQRSSSITRTIKLSLHFGNTLTSTHWSNHIT